LKLRAPELAFETNKAFLTDAYLTACEGKIIHINDQGGIILDVTNFYATSGGQPGDNGFLELANGTHLIISTAIYGADKKEIVLVPETTDHALQVGDIVISHIDWDRRYKLMRMHTACHLLSVVCPYPITSANVNEIDSRVDFDLPDAGITKEIITEEMMALVRGNYPVYSRSIREAELDANPDMVKSKNVKPPRGLGDIRLICIGNDASVDSQPCGGTHVSETQEVGDIHIGKIEKKGKENRRFRLRFGPMPQA
jgi:misacylated tRNA(Ala) deacylase